MIRWLAFAAIAAAIILPNVIDSYRGRSRPAMPGMSFRELVLPILPWLVPPALAVWILIMLMRQQRARKGWDTTPLFHLRHVIELRDDGLLVTREHTSSQWPWAAMRGWVETRNLLIVYRSDGERLTIPKRAFPDEAALAHFRAVIERNVAAPAIRTR